MNEPEPGIAGYVILALVTLGTFYLWFCIGAAYL